MCTMPEACTHLVPTCHVAVHPQATAAYVCVLLLPTGFPLFYYDTPLLGHVADRARVEGKFLFELLEHPLGNVLKVGVDRCRIQEP